MPSLGFLSTDLAPLTPHLPWPSSTSRPLYFSPFYLLPPCPSSSHFSCLPQRGLPWQTTLRTPPGQEIAFTIQCGRDLQPDLRKVFSFLGASNPHKGNESNTTDVHLCPLAQPFPALSPGSPCVRCRVWVKSLGSLLGTWLLSPAVRSIRLCEGKV